MVTARDGAMAVRVLAQSGVCAEACRDAAQIATLLREGAGALLIAEEVLSDEGFAGVKQQLLTQEPWSDLPVLVLARAGVDSLPITDAMQELANLTVLERPMRVSSLVSATRSDWRLGSANTNCAERSWGCRRRTSARRNFWPPWPTSCATPWRPCAPVLNCWPSATGTPRRTGSMP